MIKIRNGNEFIRRYEMLDGRHMDVVLRPALITKGAFKGQWTVEIGRRIAETREIQKAFNSFFKIAENRAEIVKWLEEKYGPSS